MSELKRGDLILAPRWNGNKPEQYEKATVVDFTYNNHIKVNWMDGWWEIVDASKITKLGASND